MSLTKSKTTHLSGLLLDWYNENIQLQDLQRCANLHFVGNIEGTKWEEFDFVSNKALLEEDTTFTPPPYHYNVVCRRSGSRMLVTSVSRDVINYLFDNDLRDAFHPRLQCVSILVDKLVKDTVGAPEHQDGYDLTLVHARMPAFGVDLKTISFYGNSIAKAAFFRNSVHLLTAYTCGLRSKKSNAEIAIIGAEGSVSFYLSSVSHFSKIETLLSYLRRKEYLLEATQ